MLPAINSSVRPLTDVLRSWLDAGSGRGSSRRPMSPFSVFRRQIVPCAFLLNPEGGNAQRESSCAE